MVRVVVGPEDDSRRGNDVLFRKVAFLVVVSRPRQQLYWGDNLVRVGAPWLVGRG